MVIPILIDALDTRTGGFENKGTSRDHRNNSFGIIGQNIQKRPGNLRRFALIHTPRRNHRLTLV